MDAQGNARLKASYSNRGADVHPYLWKPHGAYEHRLDWLLKGISYHLHVSLSSSLLEVAVHHRAAVFLSQWP